MPRPASAARASTTPSYAVTNAWAGWRARMRRKGCLLRRSASPLDSLQPREAVMKLSVWGLGYVGTFSAGCLAQEGHDVIGVDSEQTKVDLINAGKTPIIEKDIGRIIRQQVAAGRLSATMDAAVAVQRTDLFLICVGTPSRSNGDIELKYVRRVCEQIGAALRSHPGAPVVAIRSTLLPGTMREVVIPTLEACSGRRAGLEFGVCINPEFLREGTAVRDYFNPPKTVI